MITEEQKKDLIRYHILPTDYRLIFRLLSLFISWYFNKSILLGLFHFFLGWVYIIYVLLSDKLSNGNLGKIVEFYLN